VDGDEIAAPADLLANGFSVSLETSMKPGRFEKWQTPKFAMIVGACGTVVIIAYVQNVASGILSCGQRTEKIG